MGLPAPAGVGAAGTPPTGDKANAVVSGAFTGIGTSAPFAFYGSFNFALWGSATTSLTTTINSSSFSVVSATGLVAGQSIKSGNVPQGTTIGTISGTSGVLAFPSNVTDASVKSSTDASAVFESVAWVGSVQLERSFDGGVTWLICGIGGAGQGAIYTGTAQAGVPVCVVVGEPERQVLYRLNCTVYSAGTINYRLSETGLMAVSAGVPPG